MVVCVGCGCVVDGMIRWMGQFGHTYERHGIPADGPAAPTRWRDTFASKNTCSVRTHTQLTTHRRFRTVCVCVGGVVTQRCSRHSFRIMWNSNLSDRWLSYPPTESSKPSSRVHLKGWSFGIRHVSLIIIQNQHWQLAKDSLPIQSHNPRKN